jgi:transglutaminase-like putative cysteine protease
MRIRIAHETRYRYEYPVRSIIQLLRMTPRGHAGQHVVQWRIEPDTDGRLRMEEDAIGNIVQVFSADGPLDELSIRVSGEVETTDTAGLVSNTPERLPDLYYLRDTPLTASDEAIRTMAESAAAGSSEPLNTLHNLLGGIHGSMTFDVSPTDVGTTAIEAFRLKRGVCQDLTHIFIAAARHLAIPARYVSGYFMRNDGIVEQDAGHAWAEAKVPELGWVGFDPTNGICPTEAHVRVATALDYLGAAPIRGSRRGGGSEALDVKLRVESARRQTQS